VPEALTSPRLIIQLEKTQIIAYIHKQSYRFFAAEYSEAGYLILESLDLAYSGFTYGEE